MREVYSPELAALVATAFADDLEMYYGRPVDPTTAWEQLIVGSGNEVEDSSSTATVDFFV